MVNGKLMVLNEMETTKGRDTEYAEEMIRVKKSTRRQEWLDVECSRRKKCMMSEPK